VCQSLHGYKARISFASMAASLWAIMQGRIFKRAAVNKFSTSSFQKTLSFKIRDYRYSLGLSEDRLKTLFIKCFGESLFPYGFIQLGAARPFFPASQEWVIPF